MSPSNRLARFFVVVVMALAMAPVVRLSVCLHERPLAEAWKVRSWPASFLVDAQGTVRHSDPTEEQIRAAIEALSD